MKVLLTVSVLCVLLGVSTASNLPNDPELAEEPFDVVERPHSRALTSIFSVLANVDCQTGISLGSIVGLIGIPVQAASCICKASDLVAEIELSKNATTARAITLCAGSIKPPDTIDITLANFRMTCLTPGFFACTVNGRNRQRIFEGAPISASFQEIALEKGNARSVGGALYLTGGTASMTGVGVVNNEAGAGGGIYVGPDAELSINSANFIQNVATERSSYPNFHINRKMRFAGGGAILVDGGVLTMDEGSFYKNEAEGSFGGAILGVNATITITSAGGDVTFEKNDARESGGAIAVFRSTVDLADAVFRNNSAEFGNDLYIADDFRPEEGGSLISCSEAAGSPVSFCNGLNLYNIFEEGGPWANSTNSDCLWVGLDEASSSACPQPPEPEDEEER